MNLVGVFLGFRFPDCNKVEKGGGDGDSLGDALCTLPRQIAMFN